MGVIHDSKKDLSKAYVLYADMLYRVALAQLNSREDAEDAVQDAFAKYLSHPVSFGNAEHERAWLIRVTVNRCHDIQRSKKHRTHVNLEAVGEAAFHDDNSLAELIGIISTLAEKYKTVIILHYLEGFSVEEIASSLGISASGVKMRLSRGRELLEKILEKEGYNVKQR